MTSFARAKGGYLKQVIKGWDLAIATMRTGETARLRIAPEFAYGEDGAGEKIPGNATLVFEVELMGFKSKDDLFGDELVLRTLVAKGEGKGDDSLSREAVRD